MEGAAVLGLLLADGRAPTGGFAHSAGLEAAALTPDQVGPFIAARLNTAARMEATVAHRAAAGRDPLWLDDQWAARTPSPPLRRASRRLGRALLRLGGRLCPGALDAYAAASSLTPRPVVLGLLGRQLGMAPAEVARISLYEDAATVAGAAVKLMPIDALDSACWVADCAALIERLVIDCGAPGPIPAASTPLIDLRALDHDRSSRRLFAT